MLRLITIATVPVVVILFYIYRRDKYDKEPFWLLLASFLGGAATVPFVIIWETYMSNFGDYFYSFQWQSSFIGSFVVAALCEESSKLLVFMLLIWRNSYFNEKFDAIVYAVYISLGFALVENILYVIEGGHYVGLTRALTAVPAHAIFAISMGYYLGIAKFSSRNKLFTISKAWLIPIILHGTYNYVIMEDMKFLLSGFIIYVVALYMIGFKKLKSVSDSSVFKKDI